MSRLSTRDSLAWKIAWPILVSSFVLLAVGVAAIHLFVAAQLAERQEMRARSIAQSIGYHAEHFTNRDELQRLVFAAGAEPEVELVLVAGGAHEVIFAATPSKWNDRRAPNHLDASSLLTRLGFGDDLASLLIVSVPIRVADYDHTSLRNYPAQVLVGLDIRPVRAAARHITLLAGGAYGLALLALSGFALAGVRRHVVNPLHVLAQTHLPPNLTPESGPDRDEIDLLDAALVTTFRDIATARAERDDLLQAFEQHLIVGTLDANCGLRHANDRLTTLVGPERTCQAAADYLALLTPDNLPATHGELRRAATGNEIWRGEIRIDDARGTPRRLATTAVPLPENGPGGGRLLLLQTDVTALRRAEDDLHRLSDLLAEAQRIARLGAWDISAEGNMTWSRELHRLHGLGEDGTPSTERLLACYESDESERLRSALLRAQRHGEAFDLVCPLPTTAGRRWLRISGRADPDARGRVVGFAQDVTEAHDADAALRAAESRLRAAMQTQRDLICRIRPDGRIGFANHAFRRFFGLDETRQPEVAVLDLLPDEIRASARAAAPRLLSGRIEKQSILQEHLAADGRPATIEWELTPVFSAEGEVIEIQAIGVDATARMRAEAALRKKTEELDLHFETSLDLLCVTDLDGRCLRINAEFARQIGLPAVELADRRLADLAPPEDAGAVRTALAATAKSGDFARSDFHLRRHDGTRIPVEWRLTQRDGLIRLTGRDTAELHRVRDELAQARQEIEKLRQRPNPPVPVCPPVVSPPAPQPATSSLFAPDTRLLLAEDNPINQQVVIGLLGKLGLKPEVVDDGQAALDALAARPYHLVLMDVQMPVLDGLAATRALRASPRGGRPDPTTPVVGLTAHALAGDREAGLAAGLDDYLTKPIDPAALRATLLRYLTPHRPPTESPESAPLNRAELAARFLGDEALAGRILEKFRPELTRSIETIAAALRAGDSERARRDLHTLKGTANNLAARPLAEAAAALERALRESPPADDALAALRLRATELAAALAAPFSPPSSS